MRRHLTDMPIIALTFWMLALTVVAMFVGVDRVRDAALAHARRNRVGFDCLQHGARDRVLPCRLGDAGAQAAAGGQRAVGNDDSGARRFLGHGLLGERPFWQDYVALVLILIALSSVFLTPKTAAS